MAKKRAFVKYTKKGKLIPGSLIVTTTGGYPINGLYTEVPTNICCDTDTPGIITSSPKGWVRYTKKGAIVPGSLIIGKSHPNDGIWKEVSLDLCCNTIVVSNWYLREVFDAAVNHGDITFPDQATQTASLNPNLVGDFNGSTYVMLYINVFDIDGVDRTNLLSGLVGHQGTLTLTQGTNSVTYSYTDQAFYYITYLTPNDNVGYDFFYLPSQFGSLTLLSPASGNFNLIDPIQITVIGQEWYQITECNTANTAISTMYSSGTYLLNDRVTYFGGGDWIVTNIITIDPGGTQVGISSLNKIGCPPPPPPPPPPIYTYSAQYNVITADNACYDPSSTPTVYSYSGSLGAGVSLFYNSNVTNPVIDGYYSVSDVVYSTVDGIIDNVVGPCVNLTLRITNSPNFNIGQDASFTIEWWGNMSADDNHPRIFSIGSYLSGGAQHAVSIENGTLYYWANGGIVASVAIPTYPYIRYWAHFCIMRVANVLSIYVNGVQQGGFTDYGNPIPTNGRALYLGSEGDDSIYNGLISNFRWVNTDVYQEGGFPVPIAPLSSISGTKLLIFQGNSLSQEITDNSGNTYAVFNNTGIYNFVNPFYGPSTPIEGAINFGNPYLLQINDSFRGGKIVTIDPSATTSETHGVIVSDGSPYVNWIQTRWSPSFVLTGATSAYDSAANTALINSADPSNEAAAYCASYIGGGYTDWYLPARSLAYNALFYFRNLGYGALGTAWFWTSTEFDASTAYIVQPSNINDLPLPKNIAQVGFTALTIPFRSF